MLPDLFRRGRSMSSNQAAIGPMLPDLFRLGRSISFDETALAKAGAEVKYVTRLSTPAANGLQTVLVIQAADNSLYFDAAGFPGRTVGLENSVLRTSKKILARAGRPHN